MEGVVMLPFLTHFMPRVILPGSTNWSAPGTFAFTVPEYDFLTLDLSGAGGGGGSANRFGGDGGTGGTSSVSALGLSATGGTGGLHCAAVGVPGAAGNAGAGSGGDTNITGGGASGGAGNAQPGANQYGGNGGNGGRMIKTFIRGSAGAPIPGTILSVVIGAGGSGGIYATQTSTAGADGANGYGSASWH